MFKSSRPTSVTERNTISKQTKELMKRSGCGSVNLYSRTQEASASRSVSLRLAWATQRVPGQPVVHSEIWLRKVSE